MSLNRSLRFYGIGIGPTPVEVTFNFNGVEVHSGPIPTVNDPIAPGVDPFSIEQIMFTIEDSAEYNTEFNGVVPVSVTMTQGQMMIFTTITGNYWGTVPNPAFTTEQYIVLDNPDATPAEVAPILISCANPPFSPEEETLLITLMEAFPDRSNELNNLREAHNVAYSMHSSDSWQDCMEPEPDPNPNYPCYVQNSDTVNFDVQIIAFK
jgi:hypothetical protein